MEFHYCIDDGLFYQLYGKCNYIISGESQNSGRHFASFPFQNTQKAVCGWLNSKLSSLCSKFDGSR